MPAELQNADPVQVVMPNEAMFCLECGAISNTKRDCPKCGNGHLWAIGAWLEREVENSTAA